MEILLNGKPLEIEGLNEEVTVLELLESVEDSLKGSGATVIEIFIDEKDYSPDDNEHLEKLRVLDFSKIEFMAATAQDMVRAGFEDGEEGLRHLEEMAMNISADLRIGKVKEAMDAYVELVDGIEWLVTMLKNADRAFASSMAESSLESDRQAFLTRISEQMSAVHGAQEGEDWVGLADILEYEFPEIFQDGIEFINKVLEA